MGADLNLTSPHTKGPAVKTLQRILAGTNVWKKNFRPGQIDGVYGPGTAGAIARAKYWMGYPSNLVSGAHVRSTFYKFMSGEAKLPLTYRLRQRRRIAAAAAEAEKGKMRVNALKLARSQVGTKESPSGSNRVKYSTWYGMIGPWCAMFTTWCYVSVGSKVHRRGQKWAYVPYLLHATSQAGSGVTRTADPQPGDLVLFDWGNDRTPDHIGFFDHWVDRPNGRFKTVEGNTSVTNYSNGGEVQDPVRHTSDVQAFVKVHG